MRRIFRAIFGAPDTTKSVVDGAIAGLDALVFTDEEKSRAAAGAAEWYLRYLAATQPQNLARRLIALVIVFLWSLLILVGVAARGIEVYFGLEGEDLFSDYLFEVLAAVVMNPFLMVMGFYFAAHVMRAWQGDKK